LDKGWGADATADDPADDDCADELADDPADDEPADAADDEPADEFPDDAANDKPDRSSDEPSDWSSGMAGV
jgi:hypothetical protein